MKKPNIDKFTSFFFDLDGTLYLGKSIIDGADKFIALLNKKNKKIYALTNNCIAHKEEYFQKLQKMGINIKKSNVLNSTKTVVDWINKSPYKNSEIYVHGTNSMVRQMQEASLKITNNTSEAEFIVIGNKTDCTWNTLTDTAIAIQKGIKYIVANADLRLPLGDNLYGVDTGSTARLIATVSAIEPLAVLGKTYPGVLDEYISGKSIYFGDRIYTDMKCAKIAKISGCLVLSGEATQQDYEKNKKNIDYCVNSIKDLIK